MESEEKARKRALETAAGHIAAAIEALPEGCEATIARLTVANVQVVGQISDLAAEVEAREQSLSAVERDRKDAKQRERDAEHHRDLIAAAARDEEARKVRAAEKAGTATV